jgi:hypothetical protein
MNLAWPDDGSRLGGRGHMPAKIEDAYLNLLRLAILIVAGLALIAAAGRPVFGGTTLSRPEASA